MSDFIAPPAVLRLADAYVSPLPQQEKAGRERNILRRYVRMFFKGFVDPKGYIVGGDSAGRAGFQAGQEYRRSNPEKLTETMEGFGYTATNAQGTWSVSFEHSGFRTDSHSGRDWWLTRLPVAESSQVIELPPWISAASVRISGFLSPKGRYGHRGMYEREFLATNIVILGPPDTAAKRSQPTGSDTNRTPAAAGSRR